MQNRLKRVPGDKLSGQWITNCLVDLGKFYLHANWAWINPRDVHSSSSVSENDIISNINSTGAMVSSCLTRKYLSGDYLDYAFVVHAFDF